MDEIITAIDTLMNNNYIHAELVDWSNHTASYIIYWGDWKHDHARFNYLVRTLYPTADIAEELTEEDGSDCYSAIHRIFF